VDFPAKGYSVGMKRKELEVVSASEELTALACDEEEV
jgi:hypothetical protein